jgi:2-iminoacetate synthase ThiH
MGGAMMEENVVAAAGTVFHLSPQELRRLIVTAGFEARQRDQLYRIRNPDR